MSGRSSNALFARRGARASNRAPRSKWRKGKKRLQVTLPDIDAFEAGVEANRKELVERLKKRVDFSKRRYVRNAVKLAPEKTGALKKSIRTGTELTDDELSWRSIPIWYAVYVEFVPPRIPFIWPSYMKEREYMPKAVKRELRKFTRELASDIVKANSRRKEAA